MYDPLFIILLSIIIVQNAVLLSRRRISSRGERSILVDTSVLIDGRILDIAQARFVPGRLLIPRSVLGELQLLADGSDHEKRLRARSGLELISKLQSVPRLNVDIYHDASQAPEGVDERLLTLAGKNGFEICTVDYNLQKVAEAQGIKTLSINELSRDLKALYLPGERLDLALTQKGQEKGQAVGYASDGTMIVVDNAETKIGQTVSVEVVRSLQTSSGKMMFARMPKSATKPVAKADAPLAKVSRTVSRSPRGRRDQAERTLRRTDTPAETRTETAEAPDPRQKDRTHAPKRSFSRRRPASAEDNLLDLVDRQ